MRRIIAISYPILAVAAVSGSVRAADWTTDASVTPGVTYTDNVCLSKNNTEDHWIGTVTPAGTVEANGNRANLRLVGSVEVNTLTDSKLENLGCTGGNLGDRQQFAPSLTGNADTILLEQWVFLDATTTINQNQVTPFASGGSDSFDRTGNTNTTYNYSVSPYVQRRFKDIAELNLRYTWDDQYNTADAIADSSEHSASALFSSVPGVNNLSWGLQGDYSKTDYSDSTFNRQNEVNQDSELKSAQFNLGYQLTRTWQVNGFYGNEWNDFVSSRDDIDGDFWDVGVRWTPNTRITVEAGQGDRFFGNSPRGSIEYRHKRSALTASYSKTVTYDRNLRTLSDSPPLNPDFPTPPGVNPGVTTNTDSPILDERFSLGYSYRGLRTEFGASAFQSDQTQEGGSSVTSFTEATYKGISLSLNREFSRQTSFNAAVNWNEQKPKNSTNDNGELFLDKSETWSGRLGISRQLSQRTNVGLRYIYTDRQSDNEFDTYTENQIILDLKVDL